MAPLHGKQALESVHSLGSSEQKDLIERERTDKVKLPLLIRPKTSTASEEC